MKGYLDAASEHAAAPVARKYAGVLAAADVFLVGTTFVILESLRLESGVALEIHP